MALEEPAVVVALDEGPDHRSGLLEGFEVVQIDALLLERLDLPRFHGRLVSVVDGVLK